MINFKKFFNIMEATNQLLDDAEQTQPDLSIKEIQEKAKEYLPRAKKLMMRAFLELQQENPPLIYSVLKRMKFCPVVDKQTMAVDMLGNLWYNPLFVQQIEEEYTGNVEDEYTDANGISQTTTKNHCIEVLKGILMHEAMHILDRTMQRVHYKSGQYTNSITEFEIVHQLGNYAYDLIINRDVIASGHRIIKDGILAEKQPDGRFIYKLDVTTKYDKEKDFLEVDVTRFSGEKAFDMFVFATEYIAKKIAEQVKQADLKEAADKFVKEIIPNVR